MTLKLGELVNVPDVSTPNTPDLFTVRLTMTLASDSSKTSSIDIPLTISPNYAPTLKSG